MSTFLFDGNGNCYEVNFHKKEGTIHYFWLNNEDAFQFGLKDKSKLDKYGYLLEFDEIKHKVFLIWSRAEPFSDSEFHWQIFSDINGNMDTPLATWKEEKEKEIRNAEEIDTELSKQLMNIEYELRQAYDDATELLQKSTTLVKEANKTRRLDREDVEDALDEGIDESETFKS